jgi:hypothetical protein
VGGRTSFKATFNVFTKTRTKEKKMKNRKKIMLIGLVFGLVALISISPASAVWIGDGTVNTVSALTTGNYSVNATFGSDTFTFTIDSSAANANAMLSIALTAAATGDSVHVDYSAGGVMNRIWLVK